MKMDLEQFDRRVIVTGGAGFIGSNLLMHLVPKYPDYLLVNIDCLTYAANLSNLKPIENSPNYVFERVNICDRPKLKECFDKYSVDAVIHLAAESHVDRSILGPADFINTNIIGTFNLLELARARMEQNTGFTTSPPMRFSALWARRVFSVRRRRTVPTRRTRLPRPPAITSSVRIIRPTG